MVTRSSDIVCNNWNSGFGLNFGMFMQLFADTNTQLSLREPFSSRPATNTPSRRIQLSPLPALSYASSSPYPPPPPVRVNLIALAREPLLTRILFLQCKRRSYRHADQLFASVHFSGVMNCLRG
ncbi:uncharacterized protein [Physcomitrium patens]|uniref:uncharacterized protein n=1 Tax=Physcomitrium patens TaxID=3218 RepID=UPI003CCDEE33